MSFGHFLIKQVVEEISRENARLKTFVTLSPVPDFARWLERERKTEHSAALYGRRSDGARWSRSSRTGGSRWRRARSLKEPLLRAAGWYFLRARNRRGLPVDPVARFHLGNGARLERLNWLGDVSGRGLAQSHGLMVNYLYDLDDIEQNHEAYAEGHTVVASNPVRRLVRKAPAELVPATV